MVPSVNFYDWARVALTWTGYTMNAWSRAKDIGRQAYYRITGTALNNLVTYIHVYDPPFFKPVPHLAWNWNKARHSLPRHKAYLAQFYREYQPYVMLGLPSAPYIPILLNTAPPPCPYAYMLTDTGRDVLPALRPFLPALRHNTELTTWDVLYIMQRYYREDWNLWPKTTLTILNSETMEEQTLKAEDLFKL